jgi:hypothetical protein
MMTNCLPFIYEQDIHLKFSGFYDDVSLVCLAVYQFWDFHDYYT